MKRDYNHEALLYAEKYGIYEYKVKGATMTYYCKWQGWQTVEFYKKSINLKTGKYTAKLLRYKHTPKFLINENGNPTYNLI